MLKVYLDWNCITDCEYRIPNLKSMVAQYAPLAIFPFSSAHLSDLLASKQLNNPSFDVDLQSLTDICQSHYLQLQDNVFYPRSATPQEVLAKEGNLLQLSSQLYNAFSDSYKALRQFAQNYLPKFDLDQIRKANSPKDAIKLIEDYISKHYNTEDLRDLFKNVLSNKQKIDLQIQFQNLCLGLDLFGYKSDDKHKPLNNTITDIKHILMAASCDVFVSGDKKLRDKAKIAYSKMNVRIEILEPSQLEDFLRTNLDKAFSLDYLRECAQLEKGYKDGSGNLHIPLLPTPVFGFFNACVPARLVDEHTINAAAYKYSFGGSPFLFYTEIERFLDLVEHWHTDKKAAERFRKVFSEPLLTGHFSDPRTVKCVVQIHDEKMHIIFSLDPSEPSRIPLMEVFFDV